MLQLSDPAEKAIVLRPQLVEPTVSLGHAATSIKSPVISRIRSSQTRVAQRGTSWGG